VLVSLIIAFGVWSASQVHGKILRGDDPAGFQYGTPVDGDYMDAYLKGPSSNTDDKASDEQRQVEVADPIDRVHAEVQAMTSSKTEQPSETDEPVHAVQPNAPPGGAVPEELGGTVVTVNLDSELQESTSLLQSRAHR